MLFRFAVGVNSPSSASSSGDETARVLPDSDLAMAAESESEADPEQPDQDEDLQLAAASAAARGSTKRPRSVR